MPVNFQIRDCCTALIVAVQGKHMDVVEVLLKHGADPSETMGERFNALDAALQQKDQNMEILINGYMPPGAGPTIFKRRFTAATGGVSNGIGSTWEARQGAETKVP